jgi:general secretion pathway protein L
MMVSISELKELFSEWIATIAEAIDAAAGRYVQPRLIQLSEDKDNIFTARVLPARHETAIPEVSFRLIDGWPDPSLSESWKNALHGSRVEVLLRSDQVMFRSLDFPRQAGDFIDGMIRAQIDRLTPWTATDAVFGWSPPANVANERIEFTLAATSKHGIQPFVQLANKVGAISVAVFADIPASEDAPAKVKLFDASLRSKVGWKVDVPRLLKITLLSSGLAAAASVLIAAYVGNSLEFEQQQLQRAISERRASLRLNTDAADGSGFGLLTKRKQTTPSSVMALEAITRVLPDNTHVTELRIEGDKIQVVGVTQDAPSLIRLMEQSPQFSRATFFAPTTRAQNDPGERFHIEAHLTPYFGSGS